jgi:hypothetical protein
MRYLKLLYTFAVLFVFSGVAGATNTDLNLKILPKDCVFDVVNVGTQELLYYTPEACGFPAEPETPTPNPAVEVPSNPFSISSPQGLPRAQSRPVSAPIVRFPANNSRINDDRTVIEGVATPGTQIKIYENDALVGSVFAGSDGRWSFLYVAVISPVTLRFEACLNNTCSVLSDSITLSFDLVLSLNNPDECEGSLSLDQYRFWRHPKNQQFAIGLNTNLADSDIRIEWGDGATEDSRSRVGNTQYTHSYSEAGKYTGKVSVSSGECYAERYFSVSVIDTKRSFVPLVSFTFLVFLTWGYLAYNKFRVNIKSRK